MSFIWEKVCRNLRDWTDNEMVVTESLKLLLDISDGYESSLLLLKLESVQFVLQHHTVSIAESESSVGGGVSLPAEPCVQPSAQHVLPGADEPDSPRERAWAAGNADEAGAGPNRSALQRAAAQRPRMRSPFPRWLMRSRRS